MCPLPRGLTAGVSLFQDTPPVRLAVSLPHGGEHVPVALRHAEVVHLTGSGGKRFGPHMEKKHIGCFM